MRIVFMGTPEFSINVLNALILKYDVVGVVTKKDALVGKKQILTMSPIKKVALENNILCLELENLKEEYKKITDLKPDLIITCAYGKMLNQELLDYPKYGCINVHASLLPKLRGGAPIHKSIIYGEKYTGITIMYMAKKMDAGDILVQDKIEILEDDNAKSLEDKLSVLGAKLLIDNLDDIINKKILPVKQNELEATFAYNITREEEKIDFNKPLKDVYNQIRGLYPSPIGYANLGKTSIKILKALKTDLKPNGIPGSIFYNKKQLFVNVLDGVIEIKELIVVGKSKNLAHEFINGQGKKILQEENIFN